ncbi:MAG: peptidoglycan DD-metalloendopeptidase family protein [Bacteroidales bacterium]|nr:peptidoglycan DD-metalloendopeptidase family protein [Bacteroidales bacterium]
MKGIRFITLLLAAIVTSGAAYAQDTSKQQKKKEKLEKEIEFLNKQIKETNAKSKNAQNELKLVRRKVSAGKELVAESDRQILSLEDEISGKKHQIDSLSLSLDTLSMRYTSLVRSAYKLRDARLWYVYVLASRNFPQALRRYGYMKTLSEAIRSRGRRMQVAQKQLTDQKALLDSLKGEAQTVRNERQKQLEQVKKDERSSEALVSQLKKDKKKYQSELDKKKKQVDALNREIRNIIAAAVRAKKAKEEAARKEAARKEAERKKAAAKSGSVSSSGGTESSSSSAGTPAASKSGTENTGRSVSSTVDDKLSADFAANRGKLPWPADGSVVDHFGQHYHPVYTTVKLPFNNGVTIAVAPGSRVKAVFDGTVQQVIVMPGYNQCVLVQHGSYFTFYCKLKSVAVHSGDKVKTGQVLGTVDTIDGTTQVHFQLWKDTNPQNPENWLR